MNEEDRGAEILSGPWTWSMTPAMNYVYLVRRCPRSRYLHIASFSLTTILYGSTHKRISEYFASYYVEISEH